MTEKYDIDEENPDPSTKEKNLANRRHMSSKYGGMEEIETTIVFIHDKKNDQVYRITTGEFEHWERRYLNQDVAKKQYWGF